MEITPRSLVSRWIYPALSIAAFLLIFLLVLNKIWQRTDHHVVYALDDAYIHLALSKAIAHGHYEINPGEPTSPSSSLLWPFLLAPFASSPFHVYLPLALNFCFGLLTAGLIGCMVSRWPIHRSSGRGIPRRILSAMALLLIGNVVGLLFLGMEHSLQVLLTGCVAWGFLDCLEARQPPWWTIAAALLLPSVRYECLDITLGFAIALIGLQRYKLAALLSLSVVPLLGFAIFLKHHGLPVVPLSVLMKSNLTTSHLSTREVFTSAFAWNLLHTPEMWLLLLCAAALASLAWNDPVRARRFAIGGAAVAISLHLLLGRYGWMARYEVYAVFFAVCILLYNVHERPPAQLGWYALGLLCCSQHYLTTLLQTPQAASEIYRQQYQTSRFLTGYYNGNVAVGDLGLVAYRRQPSQYVLDLGGLGSPEVALARDQSTAHTESLLTEHHIGLVASYPSSFAPSPQQWQAFGIICLQGPLVAAGQPCVSYFTRKADVESLTVSFQQFLKTLPDGETGVLTSSNVAGH